jgi:hypothetical protein
VVHGDAIGLELGHHHLAVEGVLRATQGDHVDLGGMVLDHLLTGAGVKDVAEKLGLGVSTIGTYKIRIYEKLGVNNILDLQTVVQLHRKAVH